jgi:acetolactate synthase-1/2/3 large subunit
MGDPHIFPWHASKRGGGGVGYTLPASLGAALANKQHGRLTVSIGGDGDFMFVPRTLWAAAHHRIPMLYVVLNNRAYHQEYLHLQAMAGRRSRGIIQADIGTTLKDPNVDYAAAARAFGVHGEGPISDPGELAPALKRAIAVVKSGQPALVDVVSEPR